MKINKKDIFFTVFLSVFLLNDVIYKSIFLNGVFNRFNLIFIFFLLLLVINQHKKIDKICLLLILTVAIHATLINILCGNNVSQIVGAILISFMPMLLLAFKDSLYNNRYINTWKIIKLINFLCSAFLALHIFDLCTGKIWISFIAKFFVEIEYLLKSYQSEGRFFCLFGSQVATASVYLVCYVLNEYYYKINKKRLMKETTNTLLCLLAVVLTASRTAIIVFLCLYIYFNKGKHNKTVKLAAFMLALVGAYSIGAFDTVIARFKSGETISSGRFEVIYQILSGDMLEIKLFSGYGHGIIKESANRNVANVAMGYNFGTAYEIMLFVNLIKYGIINTIFTYYILVIRVLTKYKDFSLFIPIFLVFAQLNTYTAIWSGPSTLAFYCLFICIMISIKNSSVYDCKNSRITKAVNNGVRDVR